MNRCDYVDNTGKRCKALTNKKPNPNNNMRLYCCFCQDIVDTINEKRKEKYINEYKEKLILDINKFINDKNPHTTFTNYVYSLKEKIKNGEFDYD